MAHIQTSFAYGNGPFSRAIDLIIDYNNVREKNGLPRLQSVFPLVPSYQFKGKEPGSRQIQFMKETIDDTGGSQFLKEHPDEFILDIVQGEILERVLYTGSNYEDSLRKILANSEKANVDLLKRFEQGKTKLKNLNDEEIEIDLRDSEIEFMFNNRVATNHRNSFYVNIGAGYFYEVLERALSFPEVAVDKELIKRIIPLAKKMTSYQKIHFLSDPGVFSYDSGRSRKKETEISTPPHMHFPKLDKTDLPKEGLYVVVTGIQGIAESGIYNVASEMGLQLYSGDDAFNVKYQGIKHPPFKVANPKIKAQIARTGWSSVWGIHMLAEVGLNTGLVYPQHLSTDDPEILMNNKSVKKLDLGVEIDPKNPKNSLEEAIKLAQNNNKFNAELKRAYGTLNGFAYMADTIFKYEQKQLKEVEKRKAITPVSSYY